MSGLAARRQVGSVVSYYVAYRMADGRKRTHTIGKHGSPWTPETARQEARRILRAVVNGADPMADKIAERRAITVAELCRQYMVDVEAGRLLTRRKAAKMEIDVDFRPWSDRASYRSFARPEGGSVGHAERC